MVGAPPMCRLLFRGNAPARTGKDAFEDADMIKPGDPVDAFPDEHVFGKEEVAPLFVIVDVPDICAVGYHAFAHNDWIKIPGVDAVATGGYPHKNDYRPR